MTAIINGYNSAQNVGDALTRPSTPTHPTGTDFNTHGATQGSRPSAVDEVSNLRSSVSQVQKDVGTLIEFLIASSRRTADVPSTSSTNGPYSTTSNPTLPLLTDNNLGAWAALPSLFSETNPGATLSLLPKKPTIADVVPGHMASHFTSRKYHIVKLQLLFSILQRFFPSSKGVWMILSNMYKHMVCAP